MISIVLGTLNRKSQLELVVKNTIKQSDSLELVIVDGGSTDGTKEYIKSLNSQNIKYIEYGKKSTYSHFMNLAIKNSTYDYVCIWNTDAILINDWEEVLKEIKNRWDFYIFNWKIADSIKFIDDSNWVFGNSYQEGWMLLDNTKNEPISHGVNGELVMNYGIYNKKIFKKIGKYNRLFRFYFADGDLSNRAYYSGYSHKNLWDIKVLVLDSPKSRKPKKYELNLYKFFLRIYMLSRK